MNWFENWFNSPYYHILYKNRDIKEAELFIDNLINKLKLKKTSKLIDIACGKGRHACYFNKKGFDVVGIDLSTNSIKKAKKNENKTLKFKVHDMREVYSSKYFDIGTNLFTSFGYFKNRTDEQKAINAMSSNLKQNGILIIDFMNVKKIITSLVKKETKKINDITFNIQRSIKKGHIIKNIEIIKKSKKLTFEEKVKTITLADFHIFINNAGLKIINVFGNYQLEEFSEHSSDRLILICKKTL